MHLRHFWFWKAWFFFRVIECIFIFCRHVREFILEACLEVSTFKINMGKCISWCPLVGWSNANMLSKQYAKHVKSVPSSWFASWTNAFPCLPQVEWELKIHLRCISWIQFVIPMKWLELSPTQLIWKTNQCRPYHWISVGFVRLLYKTT